MVTHRQVQRHLQVDKTDFQHLQSADCTWLKLESFSPFYLRDCLHDLLCTGCVARQLPEVMAITQNLTQLLK